MEYLTFGYACEEDGGSQWWCQEEENKENTS